MKSALAFYELFLEPFPSRAPLIENIVSLAVSFGAISERCCPFGERGRRRRIPAPPPRQASTSLIRPYYHSLSISIRAADWSPAFSLLVFRRRATLNDANVWLWHNQLVRINNFTRVYKKKRIEKWHIFSRREIVSPQFYSADVSLKGSGWKNACRRQPTGLKYYTFVTHDEALGKSALDPRGSCFLLKYN